VNSGASAASADFSGLGFLDATSLSTNAYGVSADGSIVVGTSNESGTPPQAFIWSATGGMQPLGVLNFPTGPGSDSAAAAVSSDGSTVVGASAQGRGSSAQGEAFRWTRATGIIGLGYLSAIPSNVGPTGVSYATGVNADGSVIVGASQNASSFSEAFRWTQVGGMVGLGSLGGSEVGGRGRQAIVSSANGVSADGSVVVGQAADASNYLEAFRWTQGGGMVGLGSLGGLSLGNVFSHPALSDADAVSADGSVVVGQAADRSNVLEAFRWTRATGMIGLGFVDGAGVNYPGSVALGVNSNGSVIVGQSSNASNTSEAFRWTQATGIRSLAGLLAGAGVNLGGWQLLTANAVSLDGQFIVGQGVDPSRANEAYEARYVDNSTGGLTTLGGQQNSVNQLDSSRVGLMVQERGFAAPLIGDNWKIRGPSETGVFATLGSEAGGGAGRINLDNGLSILGGVSVATESYPYAHMSDAVLAAGAARYIRDIGDARSFFAEVGGWVSPSGTYQFSRNYANGAGVVSASGSTSGTEYYVFSRIGGAFEVNPVDEIAVSVELGRQSLSTDAYSESITGNPFYASVSSATNRMDVVSERAQWSHDFSPQFSTTAWAAVAEGFDIGSNLTASVLGFGTLSSTPPGNTNWVEYGARVSYRVTDRVNLDVFANGVSGEAFVGTRAHFGGGVQVRF
jgi:probable HAF family extracellular repeat protein